MKIDTGMAVVIVAVLVFYLRLIVLQRQRAKQLAAPAETTREGKPKPAAAPNYSLLSSRLSDRIIGGLGLLAMTAGVLLYARLLPWPAGSTYWWIPAAAGMVAFSWLFRL